MKEGDYLICKKNYYLEDSTIKHYYLYKYAKIPDESFKFNKFLQNLFKKPYLKKDHKYRIQIIYNYPIAWGGTTGSFTRQLPDEFKIYYIKEYLINDILFKEDILTCFFYSKNEERENKLKKLNERRRLFNL